MPKSRELEKLVAEVPLLQVVPFAEFFRTCTHVTTRSYDRNASLWQQGEVPDGFAFVTRGRVKLFKPQPSGKQTILDFVEGGALLCASIPYSCERWCCSAVADRHDTVILSVLRQQFLELTARHPILVHALFESLSCRAVTLCSRVSEIAAGKVEQRIALLLLRLGEQLGVEQGDDGIWIPMSLSRRDLAELCATTVESSIRTMCKLEKEGLVVTRSHGFHVRDKKALGRVAEGHAPPLVTIRR